MKLSELETLNKTTININNDLKERIEKGDYLVIDVETNGLYDTVSRCWVICVYNPITKTIVSYSDEDRSVFKRCVGSIHDGLKVMQNTLLIMHNGLKFDLPILMKLYPEYDWRPQNVLDTLVLSRLGNPTKHGGHSIAQWASHFGQHKVFNDVWDKFDPIMEERCLIDVEVTNKVFNTLYPMLDLYSFAVEIEHSVAWQTGLAERQGFTLNIEKTNKIFWELVCKNIDALTDLQKLWPPRDVGKKHLEEFTGSRQQAASRLIEKYDWKPSRFTPAGKPQLSEEALSELDFPEAELLRTYYDTEKKIAFIKSNDKRKVKKGWLDVVQDDNKVRASINPLGAYTHRMAVSSPNMTQVPTSLREPWEASPGWVLVGVDAASLELRCMAHYVAFYDGGEWGKEVVSGDAHTVNMKTIGARVRNTAKRIIYAYPYGAGDAKLGSIWLVDDQKDWNEKNPDVPHVPNYEALGLSQNATKTDIGKAIKKRLLGGALDKVKYAAVKAIKQNGYLKGLDGRKVRSDAAHAYSAIATLCQSAGAVIMKVAIYIMPAVMEHYGLEYGVHYRYVMFIHDEIQFEARPEFADRVGCAAVEAIQLTTELLGLRVPMDGEYKVGNNWSETH